MQMDEGEIVREFKAAANKSEQIKILADLNECTKKQIVEILQKNGFQIKIRQHRPKTEEEREMQATRLMIRHLEKLDTEIREHEKALEDLEIKYLQTIQKLKERGVDLSTRQCFAED